MPMDFFRRLGRTSQGQGQTQAPETHPGAEEPADTSDADGHVTCALLLDPQKRVTGYKLGWHTAGNGEVNALAQFKALVACVVENFSAPKTGWRLARTDLFLDVTAELLASSELQSLPPEHVVLCIAQEDLLDVDARPTVLLLRQKGYRFMLCQAHALPEEPELAGLVTHFDVGAGDQDLVASLRRAERPGHPPVQLIATRKAAWEDFNACAARKVQVFVDGTQLAFLPMIAQPGHSLQPESLSIVRMMQMIQRNEDVREIEAALKHDAALTYRLLRHINSPGVGGGVEIHSLRHAVTMLGYAPLFRWLALLLATSNVKASPPFMMMRAIMRGRFVELLGAGLFPASESDNLFVVGMFSLIDQLLGVSMEEVLGKVQLNEPVQRAILQREGIYGPFLSLAEVCETDVGQAARLSEALRMSAGHVNAARLAALVWAQDVSPGDAAY